MLNLKKVCIQASAVLFCSVLVATCVAQANSPLDTNGTVATLNGQPITEQDLAPELGSKILQLRNQQYQLQSKALEQVIEQRVLEEEAKRHGISVEKLQQQEVDSKISEPTDAELEGYYLAVRSDINKPLAGVKPQLQQAVKMLKVAEARQDYANSLRAKAKVVVLLAPPKVEVAVDRDRLRGNPNAPVTIVEFSDFQCPYCLKVEATLKDLLARYDGKVKLSYRDFPMRTLHPRAQRAAEAAKCAAEQGKFWEFHDALFADQSKLDDAGLQATGKKLGLNEKTFQVCLTSGKVADAIEQDLQDGSKVGVAGTPGFFINGEFVNGAQPEDDFVKIIDRELAAAGVGRSIRAAR